ncbi:hypothetical protein [Butyricimonas hominis]|uniref:Lipoprotein n=1 Tax=Butyricimonas hominis TaxID=2763032 RepID=A0ABR7D094_9BACT|nr:hypothetical protein [Butyricimonas hominis]MBC5621314.1 hypothetical protein [Butyricimonas hominis]
MRKIFIFVIVALSSWTACTDNDNDLGPDIPFGESYKLPQGKSPADDRVVALFEKYGSYFLYEYSQKDFNWTQVAVSTGNNIFGTILGDPQYLGGMLDLLEEVWLNYYPDDFLEKNLPYRILLADSVKQTYTYERPATYLKLYLTTNTLAIAGLNEDVGSMSLADKKSTKNWIQQAFLDHLLNINAIEAPNEFYQVSDYTKATERDPMNARERGFIPSIDSEEQYGYASEWCYFVDYYTKMLSKDTDFKQYVKNMISHAVTEENSWATYLTFPLVKKKHDILQAYFLEKYGIDLQAIGNANSGYVE